MKKSPNIKRNKTLTGKEDILSKERDNCESESIGGQGIGSEDIMGSEGRGKRARSESASNSVFLPLGLKWFTALVILLLGVILFCPLQEIYTETLTTTTCTMAKNQEQTFIMVKPDGVQRGLVGEIIQRFEKKGFKLVAMKFMWADEKLLRDHYADLSAKPFFSGLVKYMKSGPVCPMVWEGLNVVKTGRVMLGETDPAKSLPGTIRGDFCIEVGRNIIHGSDAVESAKKEINLWFKPEELVKWKSNEDPWLYE